MATATSNKQAGRHSAIAQAVKNILETGFADRVTVEDGRIIVEALDRRSAALAISRTAQMWTWEFQGE
jgi:hypothetical protein